MGVVWWGATPLVGLGTEHSAALLLTNAARNRFEESTLVCIGRKDAALSYFSIDNGGRRWDNGCWCTGSN